MFVEIIQKQLVDRDVPRPASCGVYISQLIRCTRVCNQVTDFNARNKSLASNLHQHFLNFVLDTMN